MAQALECPACGARHRLDTLPDARTFRCDRCGQVLKIPAGIDGSAPRSTRGAPKPTGSAGPAGAAGASSGAAGTLAPPPRRGGSVASGQRVSATATATMPAVAPTAADAADPSRERATSREGAAPARAKRVHWYWRVLAWVVAIPLGLLVTGWPAFRFDLLNKDDLLDVFVGEGTGRYVRLLLFAAAWALVTALLVQLFVEGGRWLAARRARTEAAAT